MNTFIIHDYFLKSRKTQHAHHGKHEVKDLQEIHECAKIPINNKTSTHETNLEPPKNYR